MLRGITNSRKWTLTREGEGGTLAAIMCKLSGLTVVSRTIQPLNPIFPGWITNPTIMMHKWMGIMSMKGTIPAFQAIAPGWIDELNIGNKGQDHLQMHSSQQFNNQIRPLLNYTQSIAQGLNRPQYNEQQRPRIDYTHKLQAPTPPRWSYNRQALDQFNKEVWV